MELSSTLIYDYPTVDALALHLVHKAGPVHELEPVEQGTQVVGAPNLRVGPYARLSMGARLPSTPKESASPYPGCGDAISKVPLYRWDYETPLVRICL